MLPLSHARMAAACNRTGRNGADADRARAYLSPTLAYCVYPRCHGWRTLRQSARADPSEALFSLQPLESELVAKPTMDPPTDFPCQRNLTSPRLRSNSASGGCTGVTSIAFGNFSNTNFVT